jgi:hypothetical protein
MRAGSIVFFLAIVQLAGAAVRLPGPLVIVASAALLGLVLVEAALLMRVPLAASNRDSATVVTFDLSIGVFARVGLPPQLASFASSRLVSRVGRPVWCGAHWLKLSVYNESHNASFRPKKHHGSGDDGCALEEARQDTGRLPERSDRSSGRRRTCG